MHTTTSTTARPLLFDLYATLVRPGSATWIDHAAQVLAVSPEEVRAAAAASFRQRELGQLRSPEEAMAALLRQLGRQLDAGALQGLVEARWSFFHTISLYDDSLPVLDRLRQRGHPLGLVSNCTAETTTAIDRLGLRQRFGALALSCDLGVAKPDPAIYLHACQQLGVAPERCIFVGDGESDEHAGARALGMTTVLLRRPDARVRAAQADYTIVELADLLELPELALC